MKEKILAASLVLTLGLIFPTLSAAQTTNNNNSPQNNSNNPTTNTNNDNNNNQGNTGNPGTSNSASNTPKNPMTLVHAFTPFAVNTNGSVENIRARVNNWTSSNQMKLVCVEAQKVGGANNHLGCLSVNLLPKMSTDGDWASEFEAPLTTLSSGNYNVRYMYQGDNNMWFPVTALDGSSINTTISK